MPGDLFTASGIISSHYQTDITDVALGANGLWLGIWTGAGGTATLA
jgi:hypothetical protein